MYDEQDERTIKGCLEILYDIDHTINLLESIGIHIEGVVSESDIGGDLYEVSSEAYSIIEDTIQKRSGSIVGVSEAINTLYINDDCKENKIKECYSLLMKIKKEE